MALRPFNIFHYFILVILTLLNVANSNRHDLYLANSESIDVLWKARQSSTIQTVSKFSDASTANNFFSHNFTLPPTLVKRGISHWGSHVRLKRIIVDLLRKKKRHLKLGALGGSITCGLGTNGSLTFFGVYAEWLSQVFPDVKITHRNGCLGGTNTGFMSICYRNHVDSDVDILMLEYVLNDGNENEFNYEKLLRVGLDFPSKPFVILVQVPSHRLGIDPLEVDSRSFGETVEDRYNILAQYYDVTSVSLRNALYQLARFGIDTVAPMLNLRWNQVMSEDAIHPSARGHRVMADFIIHVTQQTYLEAIMTPFGSDESDAAAADLPPPFYRDNYPSEGDKCRYAVEFKQTVRNVSGWDWLNDARPDSSSRKWGYVSTVPGSFLEFSIDTNVSLSRRRERAEIIKAEKIKRFQQNVSPPPSPPPSPP
eukprot:CAMPEP_0175056350 /NCGR_PEP_ID=MMETSP0052_2-20121109/10618_1 /TAXON_ID=51329 ORGANISM="Polytomella parva, Strain SAG 63-3" /NCGR_SAMPLE_ID=MMETSP0052_2 /ASSEMBLY_ACC=CAM_ASM_000194 /LENGTH=424 /DNA_ID=CAMNT_0016321359 /DNA_START=66 /DNA_END=1337 /DNA_ORIENTATION=+